MFGLFFASQLLFSWVGAEVIGMGLDPGLTREEQIGEMLPVLGPLVVALSHSVGWVALIAVIVWRHRMSLVEGLVFRGMGGFRALLVAGGGMLFYLVGILALTAIKSPEGVQTDTERFLALGGWAVVVMLAAAVVMAPLLEEAIFRGLLQPALKRRLGFPGTAVLVSLIFSAGHALQYLEYLPALGLIFGCSLVLCWLREAADSLWPPVLFHLGFNLAAILLGIAF